MRHLALSAIGRDRPGIVAAVTETLLRHGVNVEDSQMSILRGHFSMMLLLAAADELDAEQLRADLRRTAEELELEALTLNEVEFDEARRPYPTHLITVYGADHPGILHAVSSALADLGVNIVDLTTRLAGEGDDAIYVASFEVLVPDEATSDVLEARLRETAEQERVEVSVRPIERDTL
jgi:glycine cleavage system transcriptional repressor